MTESKRSRSKRKPTQQQSQQPLEWETPMYRLAVAQQVQVPGGPQQCPEREVGRGRLVEPAFRPDRPPSPFGPGHELLE